MTDDYSEETYGARIAEVYDERYLGAFGDDTSQAVSFLKRSGGDGPVLELAIGTGRVALPLAEQGVEVHGIDASEAMVAKLRAKGGAGNGIPITIGSFADFSLETRFTVIYVVFNTFFGARHRFGKLRRPRRRDGNASRRDDEGEHDKAERGTSHSPLVSAAAMAGLDPSLSIIPADRA